MHKKIRKKKTVCSINVPIDVKLQQLAIQEPWTLTKMINITFQKEICKTMKRNSTLKKGRTPTTNDSSTICKTVEQFIQDTEESTALQIENSNYLFKFEINFGSFLEIAI